MSVFFHVYHVERILADIKQVEHFDNASISSHVSHPYSNDPIDDNGLAVARDRYYQPSRDSDPRATNRNGDAQPEGSVPQPAESLVGQSMGDDTHSADHRLFTFPDILHQTSISNIGGEVTNEKIK